jgi:ArsR family transcriptional regulator
MDVDSTFIDSSMRSPDPTAIRVSKALSDPTRFEILRLVAGREEISCQEITAAVALSQATVSHHLKILGEAGLVSARKQGPFHYYRAHHEALAEHARVLAQTFLPARERKAAAPSGGDPGAPPGTRAPGLSRTGPSGRRRRT